mmetsp:Transcript_34606/g.99693  ORF Transcript_34606/g.99693 Transcript_34606/m.99693 type:complete len:245 (-) Transcript_34606:495-1229(-)
MLANDIVLQGGRLVVCRALPEVGHLLHRLLQRPTLRPAQHVEEVVLALYVELPDEHVFGAIAQRLPVCVATEVRHEDPREGDARTALHLPAELVDVLVLAHLADRAHPLRPTAVFQGGGEQGPGAAHEVTPRLLEPTRRSQQVPSGRDGVPSRPKQQKQFGGAHVVAALRQALLLDVADSNGHRAVACPSSHGFGEGRWVGDPIAPQVQHHRCLRGPLEQAQNALDEPQGPLFLQAVPCQNKIL